ncbi:hypothetical protein QFC20_000289 [Naganishia adeliensis]|uniref:Uncharacterized protein n=1 Tax=Naganishia adeliensis TaxID=92952 RepID=A0ACC2X266_9TREE|nr:hypothetical protein QFC20_000289 [Naganishia adeliensis]
MSGLKPPMTPVSMGSLPTPTAHVLPSPSKSGLGAASSTLTNTSGTSPYRNSNSQLSASQKLRPEHAVVFVFDATYLTREMFFKVTAKGGSLEGIMRRLVENGKQALRAQKHLEGISAAKTASNAVNVDGGGDQGKGKGRANEDEGFEPYRDFIIALPLLLGYFKSARDLSPEMSSAGPLAGIKFGFDDNVPSGTSGDQDWLEEFGIAVSAEEESVKAESKPVALPSNDGSTQCLLKGMVAALELFDIQSHHPFVVPDFTGNKSTKGTTPSPFPAGKQLAGASALTPQTRPSPLLSALHLTPTSSRIPRRSGQSGVDETGRTDTYLIVFAGKDPHYVGEFPSVQSKPNGPDSARSTRINTLKDPTSDVLTGLPSPSPSPEEKRSRSDVKAAAIAPRTLRQTVRENRCRIYDGFGWEQVLEAVCRRDVAFGWVILQSEDVATTGDAEDGVLAKLFEALKERPQGKRRAFRVEGPWWTAKDGEKAMFKGLNAARMVKPEIETKIAADTEKNANEQDMANEAKRFKADAAAAAAAARVGTPTGLPFPSPVIPSVPGQPGSASGNNLTPQQMAALQQARAQALLQRQQAALQRSTLANANSVPNNIGQNPAPGNGTSAEQARNINQLKQATLATTAPVAGAGAQGLPATQGILHMQALQHELIRQQQAQLQAKQQQQLKSLPQAASATGDTQNAGPNAVSANNPVKSLSGPSVRPQGPPMNARPAGEIVIWKGKISTQPSRFQQDAKARDAAPSVAALISTKNGKADDFLPAQWPTGYLTITGARKLDVLELQNMARKGICRFVEFRPFVEDGGDVAKNAFMVQQFANKLANSALQRVANDEIEKMFIYHFGPLQGGGVVLVPHRGQPNAPYRLLGACFFTSPIPATLGPLPVAKPADQAQKGIPGQATPPIPAQASMGMMNPMGKPSMLGLQPPAQIRPPMPVSQAPPIPMNNAPMPMSNPSAMESSLNDLTPEQIQMLMNQLQQMQGDGSLMT